MTHNKPYSKLFARRLNPANIYKMMLVSEKQGVYKLVNKTGANNPDNMVKGATDYVRNVISPFLQTSLEPLNETGFLVNTANRLGYTGNSHNIKTPNQLNQFHHKCAVLTNLLETTPNCRCLANLTYN